MAVAAALAVAAPLTTAQRGPLTTSSAGPKHEMRGAWLATVYGIDWPSKTGSSAAVANAQRQELLDIFNVLEEAGVNAVMMQVRSMSDAMYASRYEPWSAYLTGQRGQAPANGWDPLEFAIKEAHSRGMELHAWVNPFRLSNGPAPAAAPAAKGPVMFNPVAENMVLQMTSTSAAPAKGKKKRRQKGTTRTVVKNVILDPGNPEARQHIVDVCRDIITRYDVDGLIFDDYFYPDRMPEGTGDDYNRWKASAPEGMSQADWRRHNVNTTVAEVYAMLQRERPEVRFGISPAGVGGGNGKATEPYGLTPPEVGSDWMYDRIYCDPVAWLAEGSVDYVSPQIYWDMNHATNPYAPLACWWQTTAAHFGRHSYPSHKVVALPASEEAWNEQVAQVNVDRSCSNGDDTGSIFYSTAHLTGKKASGLCEHLSSGPYTSKALMPAMTWKETSDPGTIEGLKRNGDRLTWNAIPNMRYIVYAFPKGTDMLDALDTSNRNFQPQYILRICYDNSLEIPASHTKGYTFAVAPYDRFGNEWTATQLRQ